MTRTAEKKNTQNNGGDARAIWPLAGAAGLFAFFLLLAVPGAEDDLKAGAQAPPFELTDLSGKTARLADYRGQVVLLDFWATWCQNCKEEVPVLKALHEKFSGRGLNLLAASVDTGGPGLVARFALEHKLPYRVVFARRKTSKAYRVFGLPTKFLIDQNGRVHKKYLMDTDPGQIEADIRELLDKGVS